MVMGKNVLILSASPRKGGNSDLLCDEFLRGARSAGHRAEKIFPSDLTIGYCTGCGVCNRTHACVQKDDMADLLDKLVKADAIALATPVYFYSMDAQLKTLIDRTVPRYTEISGKDFYYILTAADGDQAMLNRAVEAIRGFTEDCLDGANERGILYATGVWAAGEVKATPFMPQAYEMGRAV
jgi:multimeric flavodoxin WrbA